MLINLQGLLGEWEKAGLSTEAQTAPSVVFLACEIGLTTTGIIVAEYAGTIPEGSMQTWSDLVRSVMENIGNDDD